MAAVETDPPDHRRLKIRISSLEARIVALARPSHWRVRDIKTAGIRHLAASGITLSDGKLNYDNYTWPATWSYASIKPVKNLDRHIVSIGRGAMKSAVPSAHTF